MEDMTSRQAIYLLKGLEQSLDDYCELNDEGKAAFRMAITALELFGNAEQLPSAQPETHEERTETHSCDLISRQAAIEALFELYEYQRDIDPTEAADLVRQGIFLAEKKIEQLPSAQPVLTCKGCKYDYYEYAGCRICLRKERDLYEPER